MATLKTRIEKLERIPKPEPIQDQVTIKVYYPGKDIPIIYSLSKSFWERMEFQLATSYPPDENQLPNGN